MLYFVCSKFRKKHSQWWQRDVTARLTCCVGPCPRDSEPANHRLHPSRQPVTWATALPGQVLGPGWVVLPNHQQQQTVEHPRQLCWSVCSLCFCFVLSVWILCFCFAGMYEFRGVALLVCKQFVLLTCLSVYSLCFCLAGM